MPTIFSTAPALNTGILTPRVGPGTSIGQPAPELSPEDQQTLSQKMFNVTYNENRGVGWLHGLADTWIGSAIDLGDTLASSFPTPANLVGMGPERGDIWNLVGDYGGPIGRDLKNYYERNTGKIQLISGITGAIGTGAVAGEILLPRIASALANTTAISGSKLWQAGAAANAALRSDMLASQADAVANGVAYSVWRNGGAGVKYYLGQAAKGAGKAAFEEAAIGLTMNQNEAVWSDDVSTNILFGAAGLGIGAGVSSLGARYEVRRMMNDPVMVQLRKDTVDPQGFTAMRENTPLSASAQQIRSGIYNAKESANFTSLMLEARQATPQNATPELSKRFEGIRLNADKQAADSLQKIAVKGIPGVTASKFSIDKTRGNLGARIHLTETAHDDPTTLFGLSSMGILKPMSINSSLTPLSAALKDRDELIQNLKTSQSTADIRLGRQYENQQPLLLTNKGWLDALDPDASEFSRYTPNQVKLKQTIPTVQEYTFASDAGRTIRVNDLFLPKRGSQAASNIADYPLVDREQTREAFRILFRRMIQSGTAHQVPANPTWFQLDMAREFQKAGGSVIWQKTGITDIAAAELQSLKLKADEMLAKNVNLGSYWDRVRYNLPTPTSTERIYDGAGDTTRAILTAAQQGAKLSDLKALKTQLMEMNGFELRGPDVELHGDFIGFNRNADGHWYSPVLGFFDQAELNRPLNAQSVAEANAELKLRDIHTLTIRKQGNLGVVPDFVKRIINSPDFQMSLDMSGLADDQITGIGNFFSQASGEFLTREMRFRDSTRMLATLRTRELANRISDEYFSQLGQKLDPHIKRLNAAPNAASKTLVNQFFSNASGWDIAGTAEHTPGNFGFILKKSGWNAERLGRAVQDDEFLINPRTGAPIVVDLTGLNFIHTFQDVSKNILADVNRIRTARGLSIIQSKDFYVPPPDTRGKFVGFTFDEENRAVPGGAIVTKTREEFDRLQQAKVNDPNFPKNWTFRTKEQVKDAKDLYDLAAMDFIDPGVGARLASTQKGALASDLINPNAIPDTLDWIRRQAEQIGTDTMRVLYHSQLGIARARGAIERTAAGLASDAATRTIWDEYEAAILGWNLADTQASLSGKPMRWIEDRINKGISASWTALKWMSPTQLNIWVHDIAGRVGAPMNTNIKSFDQLANHLGQYMPYKSLSDYAEQTLKVVRPPEIRQISQKLNKLTAALVLRWFEIAGMPAMNMLGIITNMPSIAQAGRAPISATFNSAGKRVGLIDSYRILAQGFKDMLNQTKHPDWDFMVKNGDTTQQVADFNKQMSNITDRGSFNRAFFGDRTIPIKNVTNIRSLQDAKDIIKHKGVDGLISIATDTTENWSRTWAHFVGLHLADLQGITGREARHNFAREIANSTIANYNPLNRPEFYQSAFGSMFGLFMSYMQSYNQRLFRWMEQGDYKAVGHQLAMQGALFGIASTPGFNAVQDILLASGVGKTEQGDDATLIDHIYARLGPTAGSAIAHGGISQLGVALYTRGDMNYRSPSLDPTKVVAGFGIIGQAVSTALEAAQTLFSDNSLEGNSRTLEVLARHMPNRVMKGILDRIANGDQQIDSREQIVSEDRNFYESAIRMLGMRSTHQQQQIEAFYANRQMKDREAARMEVLRNETRAKIRNDPDWKDSIQTVFDKYLKNGGRPENFRTWIKDQIRSSTTRRDVNDLVKAMRNPQNQLAVWRYGAYAPD